MRIKILIICLIFFFIFYLFNTGSVLAENITYFENFDSYPDYSFPLGWSTDANTPAYWNVINQQLYAYTPPNTNFNHMVFNSKWQDYILDLDITGLSGVDRFIVFRVDHSRGAGKEEYYLKYTDNYAGFNSYVELGKGSAGPLACQPNQLYNFYSQIGQTHHFRISVEGPHIIISETINEEEYNIFDCIDNNPLLYGGFGFFNQPNGIGLNVPTIFTIDNLTIKSFSEPYLLNVPDIKQYNPIWSKEIYDHAQNWSISEPTIERWGCALTSCSMLLNYYEYLVDPTLLNDWLSNQPDGYLKNGLVNWLSITRFTKINNTINNTLPVLEFTKSKYDFEDLYNKIVSQPKGKPSIINTGGHFVIAKGILQHEVIINDPASNKDILSEVTSTPNYTYNFIPSNTDLSYIMIIFDKNLSFFISYPDGSAVPEYYFSNEDKIKDNIDMEFDSGKDYRILLLPKPDVGNYNIRLQADGLYEIETYLYDKDANVESLNLKGISDGKKVENINLQYGETQSLYKSIEIEDLQKEINIAFSEGLIFKTEIYKQLIQQLEIAKKLLNKNKVNTVKKILSMINIHIKSFNPKFINTEFSEIMNQDINTLIKTL